MSKTKVLYLVYQSPNLANGGLKSLLGVILNLKKTEPLVLTNIESAFTQTLIDAGVRVFIEKPTGNKFTGIVRLNKRVSSLLRSEKIKVLHCNDIDALWWGVWAGRINRAKVIFNIRGVKKVGDKYNLKWYPVNFCDEVIFLSQEMKEELQRRWSGPQKYFSRVSYSVVEELPAQEASLTLAGANKFLIPAVVRPLKRQLEFLQYLQLNKKDIPAKWHFHFAGDLDVNDEYCKACMEVASTMPELVTMHGFQANINQWYTSADITLIISEREGLCRGMIESISAGTPVISMEVTSAHEILEARQCGFVVGQNDYPDLLARINDLMNNPSLKSRFSENGMTTRKKLFDKSVVIDVYEKAYAG